MSLVPQTFYISRQFLNHFKPNQLKELQKVIKFITFAVVLILCNQKGNTKKDCGYYQFVGDL